MKNLLPLLVVLLAGIGVALFMVELDRGDAAVASADQSPLEAAYDYYIEGMRTTRFGSDGQATSQLKASAVTHYPDGDRAELQAPELKTFGDENDAWQVSAAAGTLVPDAERSEDRLDLQGDVELHKPLAGGDFADVRTSALTVFTTTEEVTTTAAVALQMRNTRLEGIGMQALLAENYFHLDDGKGTHEPAPRP
jgi:LPS export ABC transporter protein LptC